MHKRKNIIKIFGRAKALIGMVHLDPMPGSPLFQGDVNSIIKKALFDAQILTEAGVDAIMIENMHDVPYINKTVGSEVVSTMAVVANELKNKFNIPTGVQVLAGANKQALAIAKAAGLDFIRAEGFVFAHIADEGLFQSDAGELLRYRKCIDAEDVAVFVDIKKKHSSHAVTEDISLLETAKAAEYFLADGVIITGRTTGEKPDLNELKSVRNQLEIPIIIGSGMNAENITEYFELADAFIVGSFFKEENKWFNKVDRERTFNFVKLFDSLRIK